MTSHRWRAQWASILGASERRLASPRSWQKDELSKHRRNEAESAGEMVGGGLPLLPRPWQAYCRWRGQCRPTDGAPSPRSEADEEN